MSAADFGPETETAVARVQAWINANRGWNLAVDGAYGPNTRSAMYFVANDVYAQGCLPF